MEDIKQEIEFCQEAIESLIEANGALASTSIDLRVLTAIKVLQGEIKDHIEMLERLA